jgi:peptide/nickel transport system substrate-binding protein
MTIKVTSAAAYQGQAAEVIKQQLKDVGITVRVQQLESTVFFNALNTGDFQATLVGWVGFVDPDQWMYALFHSGGKYNQQGYSNPQLDKLLEQGRVTLDRDQRKDIYSQAQRIVAQDAPMVLLYVNPQVSAYRDNVHGYIVRPTAATISLRQTWLNH